MSFLYKKGEDTSATTTASPYWILAVIPFSIRFTIDMEKMANLESDLTSVENEGAVVDTQKIYVLDEQCVNWRLSGAKNNPVHTASFTLVPPSVIRPTGQAGVETILKSDVRDLDYNSSYDIAPQDWVFFWAMDNQKDYLRIKGLIKDGKACNDATSGLKFVGRVKSFRMSGSISAEGARTRRFEMSCEAFSEFNNAVYYNPLSFPQGSTPEQLNKLFGNINGFLAGNDSLIWVSTQEAISKMVGLFFDVDFASRVANASVGTPEQVQALQELTTANKAYLIPNTVARLLGIPEKNADTSYSYSDILFRYIGIEDGGPENPASDRSFIGYHSQGLKLNPLYQNVYEWDKKLSANMIKQTIHFDNRAVWSVLNTYLNEPVDEMYTTLKLSPYSQNAMDVIMGGTSEPSKIMPSMVCRQLPFSSVSFTEKVQRNLGYTRFVDLPRWYITDNYVVSYDMGLSDTQDINYVHLQPQVGEPGNNADYQRATMLAKNPPMVDYADISKNGLRMYSNPMGAFFQQSDAGVEEIRWWNALMADIMMRLKYTISGSLHCKGIQEPICIGDNLVFQDVLFHIDSVSHMGGIDMMGNKTFDTVLSLTYGIRENAKTEEFVSDSLRGDK